MTRPSEAEVTRAAKDVLLTFHDWPAYNSSFADGERKRALENLAAALSTPPLPSAAEVTEVLRELHDIVQGHLDDGDKMDSFTLQPARRILAALSTPPLPSAEPRDLSGFCVGCGQEAEVDRG